MVCKGGGAAVAGHWEWKTPGYEQCYPEAAPGWQQTRRHSSRAATSPSSRTLWLYAGLHVGITPGREQPCAPSPHLLL